MCCWYSSRSADEQAGTSLHPCSFACRDVYHSGLSRYFSTQLITHVSGNMNMVLGCELVWLQVGSFPSSAILTLQLSGLWTRYSAICRGEVMLHWVTDLKLPPYHLTFVYCYVVELYLINLKSLLFTFFLQFCQTYDFCIVFGTKYKFNTITIITLALHDKHQLHHVHLIPE